MTNCNRFSSLATMVAVFFFFSSFNLFSQDKREPIKQYKDDGYSLQEIISFALDSTSDAKEFRVALLSVLEPALQDTFQKLGKTFSEAYLKVILERCQSEEVSFKPGEWENSGRNKKNRRIEFFPGGKLEEFCWVFHWGNLSFPLFKGNCMNIIRVKKGAQKSAPKTQTQKPTPPAPTPTILYVKIVQKAENCWGAPGRVQAIIDAQITAVVGAGDVDRA